MALLWREAMSVGDPGLDSDHKRFLALVDDAELARNFRDAERVARGLLAFADSHFPHEEALLHAAQASGLAPEAARHLAEHRKLHSLISDFIVTNFESETTVTDEETLKRLRQIVSLWLNKHFLETDRALKGLPKAPD